MNHLKEELYQLMKSDSSIFDFIQEHAIDGIAYASSTYPTVIWGNPALHTLLEDKGDFSNESNLNIDQFVVSLKNLSTNSSGETDKQEVLFQRADGQLINTACSSFYIHDDNKKYHAVIKGYNRLDSKNDLDLDTAKSKSNLKELQRQVAFLNECNKAATIGYWEVDLDSNSLYWSDVTKIIHETSVDYSPTVDTAISFYKDGDSKKIIESSFTLAVLKGKNFNHELQIVTAKGNIKWVRSIGNTTFVDGICRKISGTFQDITKSKENTIALTIEKEKLYSVLKSSNIGTWEWNIQTNETYHSEMWAEILGYNLAEIHPVTTQKWEQLVHPDDVEFSKQKISEYFDRKSEYYEAEYRMRHKNGHWVWILDKGKVITWTENDEPLMMFGTHHDITEQKKINQRNMLFIEQTPSAIAMFDKEMRYLVASKKWKEDYHLTGEKIIGKSQYDLFPNIAAEWVSIYEKSLVGITNKGKDCLFIRNDGSNMWLKWEIKPWYSDNGSVAGVIIYSVDITKRKEIEEKLRLSEEAFRGNFEHAAIGMGLLDVQGKWLKVNNSLASLMGYTTEEFVQQSVKVLTHNEDLDSDLKLIQELVEGKRSYYQIEKRFITKSKSVINAILSTSIVRNEHQEPLYFIVQIIDTTEQLKSKNQLSESMSRLEGLIDASTHVAIIETDVNGLICTFNKGAENLLGYSRDEMILQKTPLSFHLEEEIINRANELSLSHNPVEKAFDVFTIPAQMGLYDTREWTYIKKDQTKFPVQLTVTTVKKNEIITGYLGVAVDISYIKQTEREIHTLLNVAKDQNERLKNFAHIVSHNLRSHSGNITMMMDLAVHEQPELLENELIRMLQTASTNLQETIMHLNEVVLMNSAVNENLHSINLSHYMKETIQNMHAVLFNLDIDINNTIDSNINILALPAYLESILLNLMTNAVKYRSEDRLLKINVSTEIIGEYAVLTIEDNGIGIDLKKNGFKIFGMYKTFHTNKDARGIGLFITKNQIEAINGKIEVTSQEHIGTTFKVYFRHEKN